MYYSCMTTQIYKRSTKVAGRRPAGANLADPRFFKALCDPNRLAMLFRLARSRKPCTVSEVAACCPTDLSVVSRHLGILRDAGILEGTKRGREVHYTVCYAAIIAAFRALADAIEICCEPAGCCGEAAGAVVRPGRSRVRRRADAARNPRRRGRSQIGAPA